MAVTVVDRADAQPGDVVVAVTSWDPPPGWQRTPGGGPVVWLFYTGAETLPEHCQVYRHPDGWSDPPIGPPVDGPQLKWRATT